MPDRAGAARAPRAATQGVGRAGALTDPACLFCRIVAGDVPADVVHTTDRTVAFRDVSPQAPVHVLVVPRRHIAHAGELGAEDAEDAVALFTAAREVAAHEGVDPARGYRLVLNVGTDAQNSVPHLHLHVLAGRPMTWPPG